MFDIQIKRLIEVEPGIYSYSKDLPEVSEKPLILVHPFYDWDSNAILNMGCTVSSGHRDPAQDQYIIGLKRHLESSEDPVIVFEEGRRYWETARILDLWRNNENTYLMPTVEEGIIHADPYTNLEKMIEFINLFHSDIIDFAGGQYVPSQPESGCLGQIISRFKKVTNKKANVLDDLYF
jgi:hypothetical protein